MDFSLLDWSISTTLGEDLLAGLVIFVWKKKIY